MPQATTISGTCRKCGGEAELARFAAFATASFGTDVDFGVGVTITGSESPTSLSTAVSGSLNPASGTVNFACYLDGNCWADMREAPNWAQLSVGRVYRAHDELKNQFQATLSGIDGTTLSGMLSLDPPYMITQDGLDGYFANVEPYMAYVQDPVQWTEAVASGLREPTLAQLRTTYSGTVAGTQAVVDTIDNFNDYGVTTIPDLNEPPPGSDFNKTEIIDILLLEEANPVVHSGSQLCNRIIKNHLQLPTWYVGDGDYWMQANQVNHPNGGRIESDVYVASSGIGWIPWGEPVPTPPETRDVHYDENVMLPGYTPAT